MKSGQYHATDEQGRRSVVSLTKKRFAALEHGIKQYLDEKGLGSDHLVSLREIICTALSFNPDVPSYTKEVLQRRKEEMKKKLADNNMNTYDAYGRAYYATHREDCITRVSEYQAQRRATQVLVQ